MQRAALPGDLNCKASLKKSEENTDTTADVQAGFDVSVFRLDIPLIPLTWGAGPR
jgi:hypothetical protein